MKEKLRSLLLTKIILIIFLSILTNGQTKTNREVSVTVDDLPAPPGNLAVMRTVTVKLLESFKRHQVPAIGFVNERKLFYIGEIDSRVALLQMWLDAGLELGNHTFSHIYIDNASIKEYEEDVIRGETVTRMLLREKNMKLRYFRHTQLRTGPTAEYKKALADFLAKRGYIIAPVTIDNNENIFAVVYGNAKRRGDLAAAKKIGDEYIRYMERIFDFFEKLSIETFGREIKQTLLIHANELNADYFDELAQMMKKRGYRFITLDEALKDSAYNSPDDLPHQKGLSWLHRWRLSKNLPLKMEPSEPEFITKLYQAETRNSRR
jgi:peptidoglycan-N-acetylglucosamine deacetylase